MMECPPFEAEDMKELIKPKQDHREIFTMVCAVKETDSKRNNLNC